MKLPVVYDSLSTDQIILVRKQYCARQKWKCYRCKQSLSRNKYPVKHPIHLHHSHKTGLTLGAVHEYCNFVLAAREAGGRLRRRAHARNEAWRREGRRRAIRRAGFAGRVVQRNRKGQFSRTGNAFQVIKPLRKSG